MGRAMLLVLQPSPLILPTKRRSCGNLYA
uniref:Uncharacterized protein n=1 Tax=Anguilla anguilla TaxID=7936 RepID=A0A0E9W9D9_ANGAN